MVIGFIGLGNMAKAMIGGILKKDIVSPEDIIGSAATKKVARKPVRNSVFRQEIQIVRLLRRQMLSFWQLSLSTLLRL